MPDQARGCFSALCRVGDKHKVTLGGLALANLRDVHNLHASQGTCRLSRFLAGRLFFGASNNGFLQILRNAAFFTGCRPFFRKRFCAERLPCRKTVFLPV